ncbi:MAG: PAAR domain-containing protein [Pseudonocardiaceae bacterium]
MPPAARIGDPTGHPGVIGPPGCPAVLIGGRPAARMDDLSACGAPIAMGAPTVLIGG